MDLGLETPKTNFRIRIIILDKTNVGVRIAILEILCVLIFRQNGQLWLFSPKFAQKWIKGWKLRKLMLECELSSSRYYVCQFLGETNNFDFFGPNLPRNEFWVQNFKNLSADSGSTHPRYYVCQFSGKTDNFKFFHLNLGKLPNYMWHFGSNNVEGVAKNLVEAEMCWVEVGARFSNTLKLINYTSRATDGKKQFCSGGTL